MSTNEPEKLAKAISTLSYVKLAKVDLKGISLDVPEGKRQQLYEDIIRISKEIKVEISGIDSSTASLEELYNRAISPRKER